LSCECSATDVCAAAYYVAFGPHGPRAAPPPGENTKVFLYTMIGVGVSFATFYAIRLGGRPAPKTMTKEWQEASNEYLKEQKVEPITGVSAEGYQGPGMIQSK
jgi:cytochrome c oxidase subunit 4